MDRKHLTAYTDGSCNTQTGDGGWAFRLIYGNSSKEAAGFEAGTTNNRMELTAAVRALEALKEPCRITLTTDSEYLRKAFTDGWLETWQKNGWKTANRSPVKNQDLWRRLLELTAKHAVEWRWTKGHAGHLENERVDKLALAARRRELDES
jgi:ribonuclease HI